MTGYNLKILGMEVSFKTDVPPERVNKARSLLEERFKVLEERGKKLSKEKLLIYLSLSLADDYLELEKKFQQVESRISRLLDRLNREE
ncbi:MAG: cell division protein ZapA [Desulfonauticus sp.]|jgi:cell division protein ZapA|nr:cell division protein ZapA [Desulfonauticus sp.]